MAWQPNGGGCGTDNSVVGGGGGYMAYPQPPAPGGQFTNNAPRSGSWNGQFGPVTYTFPAGTGIYFSISNPGRSSNS